MPDIRRLDIDGQVVEVDGALTLIQACELAGVEIPRFCYHERLSIAGNCRMCLVEVVGGPPKPAASCAMQVRDLRPGPEGQPPRVRTNSPMVKRAREGVMEFLLINHPLDCPICDQGGECDLQDQAMAYGVDFSRYREPKRAAAELDLGPLIETHMTRCISCTRCVRFATEVAGTHQMGQTGRGEDAEITTYLEGMIDSNLQGNIIDLCPVGALVSKPYAFTARPWELTRTETIDVMDALGANIRIDSRGREVMRILPRAHDGINEEWISDKTRFAFDGLRLQRLDRPYLREGGRLRPATWDEVLHAASIALKGKRVAGLVGDLASVEAAYALRLFVEGLGGRVECRVDGARLPADQRGAYVGTAAISDLDEAQRILIVASDPHREAAVLNARIRKAWLRGAEVSVIGDPTVNLTCGFRHLGSGRQALVDLRPADLGDFTTAGMAIIGMSALRNADAGAVLARLWEVATAAHMKVLVLHDAAGRVGALDVGAVTEGGIAAALDGAETVFALGVDEHAIPTGPTVIYQGSHGDRGAHRADIILPSAAFSEENAIFVNTEGRPQMALRAISPPGDARENWAILRALSGECGHALPFDSLHRLRARVFGEIPHLEAIDMLPENSVPTLPTAPLESADFPPIAVDFHATNPIARASPVLADMASRVHRCAAPKAA